MKKIWLNVLAMGLFVMFAGINAVENNLEAQEVQAVTSQEDQIEVRTKQRDIALLRAAMQRRGLQAVSPECAEGMVEPVAFLSDKENAYWFLPAAIAHNILKYYEQQ